MCIRDSPYPLSSGFGGQGIGRIFGKGRGRNQGVSAAAGRCGAAFDLSPGLPKCGVACNDSRILIPGQSVTIPILLAVLAAAFLHALWNALITTGPSRLGAMIILSMGEVPIGLVVAGFRPLPVPEAWKWVLMAGCTHVFYKFFLTLSLIHI